MNYQQIEFRIEFNSFCDFEHKRYNMSVFSPADGGCLTRGKCISGLGTCAEKSLKRRYPKVPKYFTIMEKALEPSPG